MGLFSSLGKKISGETHRLGNKVIGALHKGEKFVAERGGQVSNIAGTVGNVAGLAAAGAAATGIAAPLAAPLAGLAASAKTVERVAGTAATAAKAAGAGRAAVQSSRAAASAVGRGDFSGALASGRQALIQGKTAKGLAMTLKK